MAKEVIVAVPDLGDFKSVDVIEVLVKVGDVIDADAPLLTLETEKATMDVPSTAAGRVAEVLVSRGDKVVSGTPVVRLEAESGIIEMTFPYFINKAAPVSETIRKIFPGPAAGQFAVAADVGVDNRRQPVVAQLVNGVLPAQLLAVVVGFDAGDRQNVSVVAQ